MGKKNVNNLFGQKIYHNLYKFLRHIDSIRDTLPMYILLISPYTEKLAKDFNVFLKNSVKEIKTEKNEISLAVKSDKFQLFRAIEKNLSISMLSKKIISESLFVSLISQYDAYLSELLRIIFEIKPEILNGSDKNITFSQLVKYKSIKKASSHFVEKEIDMVLRKSHSEQFDYLEENLKLKLRKNLPIWETFVEITERRNLFVHCDGKISDQYIKNCNLQEDKNFSIGKRLVVSPEYFMSAYKCLYEISVKLTHTLWRKFIPNDLENADEKLNDICFDLINDKSYNLAETLLQFASEQNKKSNDTNGSIFMINLALSKHLSNKQDEARKILEEKDWSAYGNIFKLAVEIINKNYKKAYFLMKKIGKKGDIGKIEYKEWPLFEKIRKEKKFKKVYREIFKEDCLVIKKPNSCLSELIQKYKKESFKQQRKI